MEQVKLTTGEYLLVTLPEDATWIEMDKPFTDQIVFESNGDDGKTVKLLPGQWEIIGRASELSSEAWKSVLTKFSNPFMDWLGENIYIDYTHPQSNTIADAKRTATESGLSLIKSHSMNPSTTLVIRKIK